MLRDFVYVNDDYSIRLCYVIVVFNYWTRYYPERKDTLQKRCLHVYLYGVDIHLYNRTSVYNMLSNIFKPDYNESSELLCRPASATGTSKETSKLITSQKQMSHQVEISSDHEMSGTASSSGILDAFWRHAHKLMPAIKFDFELTKICAGNHLLPRACLLTCSRIYGSYSTGDASSQWDKYQHQIKSRFVNMMGSLVVVSKYSGQHAVEEPPKSWDKAFHVFHFGEGMINYILDEPGIATSECEKLELPTNDTTVLRTWPKWELRVDVNKVCQLNYGPWADRQRDIIWRFFFPPSYQIAKPSEPISVGQPRVAKKFVFELKTSTNIDLNVYFTRNNIVESLKLSGFPNSIIKLNIPWLIGRNGFITTLHVNLIKSSLITEHLWRNLLTSDQYVNLDLKMHYPREWNMRHLWDIAIDIRDAQLTILFDYKHYFKGLIDDWCRGSHPDLLSFVPCTYKFHIKSNNLDFILLANDYNWISKKGENAHLGFRAKKLMLTFDLPFVDFLPATVPVIYTIEGSSVSLRFSIPETSTLHYLIQELHNRLKFVNGRGQLQKSSPFHSSIQEMKLYNSESKTINLQWFDCGWAPRISLRIAYVYHPSPWVSEYWHFLPPDFKMTVASPKGSLSTNPSYQRSSRKLGGSKHTNVSNQQSTELSSQTDLEESALQKLRPEGSHTQGPTENDILQSKCDVFSSLEPDTVDLHLHIPSAQLLFYGTLLRHFIHVKENYFGCHQIPVSFDREPLQPEESTSLTDDDLIRLKSQAKPPDKDEDLSKVNKLPEKRIIDPRDCRPLSVRVSLEFHNVQAHLPMHGSSNESPCPTAFLDCIGFEMDKRWHETKLQLLFSPILICFYDQNKDFRSKSTSNISSSRIQLVGLQLRGQGMFSHVDLPIRAESLEYAWLLELTVGQLTGQLSAPKMACLVQCVKEFLFSAVDSENQLTSSRAFELCQHGRPQQLCPFWSKICPITLCPSDMQLKYRMFRLTIDAIDLSIVENRNCLCIQCDPIRLAHCNRHGATHCDGMFVLVPDVRLIQFVAPLASEVKDQSNSNNHCVNTKQVGDSVLWFEAGSFSLGPVHINLSRSPEKRDHLDWQSEFLKLHDLTTKRLSFLWSDNNNNNNDVISGTIRNASLNSRHTTKSFDLFSTGDSKLMLKRSLPGYVAPDIMPNCGCYGQCSFFGQNESGRSLFNELLTGDFQQRTVFPSRTDYKPDLFIPIISTTTTNNNSKNENHSASVLNPLTANPQISTSKDNECSPKSLGFGESLLLPNCLLHELHSPHECRERHNGLLLMREEVILAYLEASNQKGIDWSLLHFCEDEDQSDTDSTKSSDSLGTYASFDSCSKLEHLIEHDSDASDMDLSIKDLKNPFKDTLILSDPTEKKKTKGSWPELNVSQHTKPSSLSDLLVPVATDVSKETTNADKSNDLAEVASLHSLQINYSPVLSNVKTSPSVKSPPTPPPRKFVKEHQAGDTRQSELHESEKLVQDKEVNIGPRSLDGDKKEYNDVFENFVDLRTQLNRPISESGLLRPAYGRHLNAYKCVAGLTCPSNLRNRWRVCKHIHPGNTCQRSLDNLLNADNNTYISQLKSPRHQNMTAFNLLRQCQPKVAIAPRFQIRHTGFSPQSITVRSNSLPSRTDVPSSSSPAAVVNVESNYDVDSVTTTIKSKAIVWLQGPVNLLLTPLLTESLERYIKILMPIVKTTSPSSIVDSMHYKCVKSMEQQIKPLLSSTNSITPKIQDTSLPKSKSTQSPRPIITDKSSANVVAHTEERQSILYNLLGSRFTQEATSTNMPHQNVTSKPFRIRKTSADYELMSNSQDTVKFTKNTSDVTKPLHLVAEISGDHSEVNFAGSPSSSAPVTSKNVGRHNCKSALSSKVAALSVERINISFLQLYAVEDLVHLDSLKSGLHDLTCVSLMTFCLDSFSFELMASYKREMLNDKFNDESIHDRHNSMSTPGSNISNRPFVASSTVESGHQTIRPPSILNTQKCTKLRDDGVSAKMISSNISDLLNAYPSFREQCNTTSINRKDRMSNSFPGRLQHKRQPSAPPVLYNLPDLTQSCEAFTRSSEPIIRKSNKWYDCSLTDSKPNPYKLTNKTEDMKVTDGHSFQVDDKLPNVEFTSSKPVKKTIDKIDDIIDSINVRPTTTEPSGNLWNSHDCEHLGSELVCQVTVHRLHGQLRRLTRHSQFNADVLLTAIPFESSRAFFRFTSDPLTSNTNTVTESSCTSKYLEEQSFGWIMFECGLEDLSISWVQRRGFPDSVSGKVTTSTEEHRKDTYNESTASMQNASPQPPLPNNSSTNKESSRVNGLSSKLRVNTVWLNFATPKRLPNKRRIELIRSDWNLLSTAAPTIRAWIDPCNRLVGVCKQFHMNSERRFLAVISCLMTEVVNPRSEVLNVKNKRCPRPISTKVQLVMNNNDLDGYARHRTQTAHILRFDPSCQLLVVLRRYLLAMNDYYGVIKADELLGEMLKDPVVPQNEFLQRGILSLTREWRFLVDSLALSISDLRASRECTTPSIPVYTNYMVDFRQNDLEEPAFLGVSIPRTNSLFGAPQDCQAEDTDAVQPVTAVKPLATNHPKTGSYFPIASPAVTSRLLKMVVGSLSPASPQLMRSGLVNVEDGLKSSPNVNTNSGVFGKQSDDMNTSVDKTVGHTQGQNILNDDLYDQLDDIYWDTSDQLSDCIIDTSEPLVRNPIMKRFLQDARANIMEHPQTCEVASRPTINITDHNVHQNTENSFANRLSSSSTVDHHVCESDTCEKTASEDSNPKAAVKKSTKSTKEKQIPINTNFDHSLNTDCKLTAADFEQAAHLSAQYRYVAYIQNLFSPLLESVGLSVKGIRRTTLMKKFDGFLSVDGLLQTFQIEIVSSARNPMVHSFSKPPAPEQTKTDSSSNLRSNNRLGSQQQTTSQRQLAFLCCNFASSLILRDIVDYKTGNSTRFQKQKTNQLSQMQTTTKMDIILHIDFIRQHVNLSLLRLVHQFVTMIYCARDTCKSVSNDHSIDPIVSTPSAAWPQKYDSKGSSDDTDGTFRSRSSAYVRFGEESIDSGRLIQGEHLKSKHKYESFTNTEDRYSSFAIEPDRSSAENTSNSSADKDLLIITNPANSHDVIPTLPSFSLVPTSRISDYDDTSLNATRLPGNPFCSPPSCWKRLANYVELYSTVPKTKTVIRKPMSASIPTMAMPTITEEDRDHNAMCVSQASKVKTSISTTNPPPNNSGLSSPTGNKAIIFSKKTFPTVTYRVLNEEADNDHTCMQSKDANYYTTKSSGINQWTSGIQAFPSRPSSTAAAAAGGGDKIQNILNALTTNEQQYKYPFIGLTDKSSKKDGLSSCGGLEHFTYPWVLGERVPLVVFVTAKIRQMAVSAVLSELNLNASIRNVHGSFTLTNQIRGRGSFTEKFSAHSSTLHCGDCNIQLTEKLPLSIQEVVCVKAGRSHAMLSCSRSLHSERNACVFSLGRIMVTLPHHPVRLHSVMQRQAKRISSTVYELLRNPNTGYTHIHSWRSSGSRMATTPTTCSTATTASDPSNNLKSHQSASEPVQISVTNAKKVNQSPPLVFSLLAVSQGLTVNVALHSTLKAVYHIDPVYVSGQLGSRTYVDISITDHSLSLKSLRPPANFPTSISLPLPRILASIVQRVSSGGRYARGQRKEAILTYGLEAEQGLYLDIQIQIDTLEQNLSTDMLNYIMVVVKLFMKEINEVIQKMAGDERPRLRKPLLRFTQNQTNQSDDLTRLNISGIQSGPNGDWILSRAARGRTKFTIKIRMKEIQLLASTKNGAIKLEARKIEVELTNRVSQTHSIHNRNGSFYPSNDSNILSTLGVSQKRPSNLNIRPSNNPSGHHFDFSPTSLGESSGHDSLFIYATIANIGLDLGYFDQDTFHALSPDFQNVAFFRTSIALRSLLADEKFAPNQNGDCCNANNNSNRGEQDAFLISLNRPIVWLKPFTLDRGIMMWMVYRDEFAKWNEHIEHLASMAPPEENFEQPQIGSGSTHGAYHTSGHPIKDRSQHTFVPSPPPPPAYSTVHPPAAPQMNEIPDVTIASNPSVNSNNKTSSTLFLQLSIEDLGVCLPIHMIKLPSQSLKSDSRTALVLTLDKSRISACYQDSLVSQGEFTDFCLRFDDEFNVGSDDWKPDKKRSTIEVKGKRHVVILNACVVPNGTFSVYWRDPEKRGKWHLTIHWQMRGLDFHLDDSIGRRLKALFTILTRMTGYNGAAPLLPTSGEEEDEEEGDGGSQSRDMLDIEECQRVPSGENEHQAYQYPASTTKKRSSTVSATVSKNLSSDADIASLDRYRPLLLPKDSSVKNTLDHSHFRSMEFHKHKLDLSDAQAFKRQKWNTLRKKKAGHMSRGITLRNTNSSSTDQCVNEYNTQPLGSQSIPTDRKFMKTGLRSSASVTEDFLPSQTHGDNQTKNITKGSNGVILRRYSNLPGVSSNRFTKMDSVYFDAEDDTVPNCNNVSKTAGNLVDNNDMKLDADSQQFNGRFFDEYSDDWCDPYRSLDVDEDFFHDADEQNTIDTDSSELPCTTNPNPTVGNDSDNFKSNIKPPTPPPRKLHNLHDENKPEFRPRLEKLRDKQTSSNEAVNTSQEEPKLQLELDLQIHVDSGCCVLHPRLPSRFMPDDNGPKHSAASILSPGIGMNPFGVSDNGKLISSDIRYPTLGVCGPTTQLESGYRFSYSDLLPGYLERYRLQLLQDLQIVSNDISVFYLPAVDVSLHYNSMTELDFLPGSSVPNAVNLLSDPPVNTQILSPNIVRSRSSSQPRNSQSSGSKDESIPRINTSAPRSIRKQADLYVSCFLQKLPKELVVQPSLLDFLEQAIDNLPLVADWNSEVDSASSDSGNEVFFEKFPVHAIVHLHVQPSTIRYVFR
uniref:Fragile site-associated protein C-terminal domain-containing protein n=1 Tax=Trichobilharzia regenti TaxID=157069 RepID=A0AA85JNU6_TRIRE|nr:unnamed protein product [Trichobilharzia regenti]